MNNNVCIQEIQVYPVLDAKISGKFLKGPIPMNWLQHAAEMGGKVLEASVILWHRYGLSKGKPFKISNAEVSLTGKSSDTGRRALKALEKAGLIQVRNEPGQKKIVTIISQETK